MSDLIDRQAAIDALDEIEAEVADGYGYQYAKWREYFVEMPSAQPEQKKGKWIERSVDVDGKKSIEEWQSAKCSVCGRYHTTPFLYYFDDFNFCPNCGAKMEERE